MTATRYDEINKIWFGPENTFQVDSTRNFAEIILEKLTADDPERVMQVDGDTGECRTTGEIRMQTIRCAQSLQRLGCTQDDRIVIIARNHHHLTALTFGAICIGSPIAPLDVYHVEEGLVTILQRVQPIFIFCDTDVLGPVEEKAKKAGIKAIIFTVNGLVPGYDSIESLFKQSGQEHEFKCTSIKDAYTHAAIIACSSGSTGIPKSILMSHALFSYTFLSRYEEYHLNTLCFSSLYWFSGVWSLLNSAFSISKRIFTAKSFSPELFFKIVEKYEVGVFVGPPRNLQSIFKSEHFNSDYLESLKLIFAVGGYLPPKLTQTIICSIPKCILMTSYGMTEVGGGVSLTMPNELQSNLKTSGRLLRGIDVKILNEINEENCGPNEKGEIHVKTPIPVLGYYNDEAETRASIDQDGFFKTGDIGYFDTNGHLYIDGRKKEVFKSSGYFVWPNEIEDILNAHPAIQHACVVAVHDKKKLIEIPAAVVIKQKNSKVTANEIYSIVADRLADYKHLNGGISFVDNLPGTPSGKIIRSKVKEIAQKFYDSQ